MYVLFYFILFYYYLMCERARRYQGGEGNEYNERQRYLMSKLTSEKG